MGCCGGSENVDRNDRVDERTPLKRGTGAPVGRSMDISDGRVSLSEGSSSCSEEELAPPVHLLQMFLDGDRDGEVDGAPANYGDWQWGAGQPGGILMVRTRMRPAEPVLERCELRFVWDSGPETRAGWSARLTVDNPGRIRFYLDRAAGSAALVLHGGVLDVGALPGAAAGTVAVWMEAADYGADDQEASWRVRLSYRFVDADGHHHDQNAQLRIAPWIMAGDLDRTASVFGVGGAAGAAPDAAPLAGYPAQLENFLTGAGITVRRLNQTNNMANRALRKPYLRDVVKGGYSHAPHHSHLVFQQNLDVNASYQIGDFRLWGIGQAGILTRAEWAENASSQNNGGNLLVSPPEADYPYGRIIYGDGRIFHGDDDEDFRCHSGAFYQRQRLQRPIVLDSSWLKVGHVDEYLSFVPVTGDAAGPWPWKILMMDPRLGYALAYAASARPVAPEPGLDPAIAWLNQICDDADTVVNAPRPDNESFDDFRGRCALMFGVLRENAGAAPPGPGVGVYEASPPAPDGQNGKIVTLSINTANGTNPNTYVASNFEAYVTEHPHGAWFDAVTPRLDADRARLLGALQRADGDVIGVPALLGYAEAENRYLTETADSVNMLVIREGNGARCLVPKPFGPVCCGRYLFEHYINRKLTELGLMVTFVNNWLFLHCDDGEVHCGTNQVPVLETMHQWPVAGAADRTWWLRAPP
jgi:hypothetical protein